MKDLCKRIKKVNKKITKGKYDFITILECDFVNKGMNKYMKKMEKCCPYVMLVAVFLMESLYSPK